jgi:two-component system LytT family response regulator
MIKTILIDDEQDSTEALALMLGRYCPSVEVLAQFNHSPDALQYLNTHSVDLVFLDVEMPHLNGFELLQQLSASHFDVIFTTAYDDFAIRAFKFNALDYLLKPIGIADLVAAVERLQFRQFKVDAQLGALRKMRQKPDALPDKIALPTSQGLDFVEIKAIVRCESDDNYTHVYTTAPMHMLVSRTLKEFEEILSEAGFMRIHQKHLINPAYIKKYVKTDGGYLVMTDNSQLPISRQRKDEVLAGLGLRL